MSILVNSSGNVYLDPNGNALESPTGGITPSGTVSITENGTTDVTNYANADVQVPIIVNENLINNWYFVDPINQRGQTSYSTPFGFAIDAWLIGSNGTLTVNNGYINIVSCVYTRLFNVGTTYEGQTVTVSLLTSSGSLSCGSGVLQNTGSWHRVIQAGNASIAVGGDGAVECYIESYETGGVNVLAVKLELGDKQTLAHQENGQWVLNEIPSKKEQLLLCQTSTYSDYDPYANKVVAASGAMPTITANGSYNIAQYETATVNVQSSWPPATITAGDTPVKFVAGYQSSTGSSLMEVSRITITRAGTYRFRWVANRFSSTGTYRTQLWKNGVAVSEEYTPSSTTWVGSYSVDVACSAGDYVCVYARGRSDSYPLGISGFTACINGNNGF